MLISNNFEGYSRYSFDGSRSEDAFYPGVELAESIQLRNYSTRSMSLATIPTRDSEEPALRQRSLEGCTAELGYIGLGYI